MKTYSYCYSLLKENQIDLIVNVSKESEPTFNGKKLWCELDIVYLERKIWDSESPASEGGVNLKYITDTIRDIIKTNRKNILIHCSAGINRSGMVAAALYWHLHPNDFDNAMELIEFVRNCNLRDRNCETLENRHFVKLLKLYCKKKVGNKRRKL